MFSDRVDVFIMKVPWVMCASLVAQMVKNLPARWETWVQYWVGKTPWRIACNPLQYSCLKNPHGQRSLAGYSPWGHKESDMTEELSSMAITNMI